MIKRVLKILSVVLLVVFVVELPQLLSETTAITSYLASIISRNNLHTVVKGRFYRSAEMSNNELRDLIKRQGIHTVIDLHYGKDKPDKDGVLEEMVATESGAKYFHAPLLGSKIPSQETIQNLIGLYDKAEVPVLIYCSSGTHRSGVASIIWLLTQEQVDPREAVKQLSSEYGYFYFERWIKTKVQGYPTIDQLIWNYLEAFNNSGITFRDWLQHGMKSE